MMRRLCWLGGVLLLVVSCGTAEEGEPTPADDVSVTLDVTMVDGQQVSTGDADGQGSDVTKDSEGCKPDDTTCDGVDDDCDGVTDDEAATGQCDDDNPCTTDACVDGKCVTAAKDGDCDDGNPCTQGESCSAGVCTGTIKDCDDGNPCTKDQCNPASGDCGYAVQEGAPCDDGDACTEGDKCKGASCVGGAAKTCPTGAPCTVATCEPSSGTCGTSPAPDGAPCEDADLCTEGDTCKAGQCQPGSSKSCAADKPCYSGACDPATGQCSSVAVADGTGCDDGNPCTKDGACLGAECKGQPVLCDDLNPCTTDACEPAVGCTATTNNNPCDDKDPCTVNDSCAAGLCVAGSAKSCDDLNPCTTDACDKATGDCVHAPDAAKPCSDGDACTLADTCDDKGGCLAGKPKICDDGKPCTVDSCDKKTGACSSKQSPAGAICDDGSFCTIADKCDAAGNCKPGQAIKCVDNNPCTVDGCVAQTGKCSFQKFPDGASCDDGDKCTKSDNCQSGSCSGGTATNCDDANKCTADSCDAKTGQCKNTATGADCDDGDACSLGEDCASGTCKPPEAGTSSNGFGIGTSGYVNGDVTVARINGPGGLDLATDGRVFLADRNNHRVRLWTPDSKGGKLSDYAGSGSASFLDGPVASARFYYPSDVAWHASSKTLYVADRNNHRVRKIVGGQVTTLAGSSSTGSTDGKGSAARFSSPEGLDVSVSGVVYVADTNNHKIRRITADGQVTTLAGTGATGYVNGAGTTARFSYPRGLAVRPDGSILVADSSNHRIRKVSAAGAVSLFAGSGSAGVVEGAVASARFNGPFDVDVTSSGVVYVADNSNRRIRKIAGGQVSTHSGSGGSGSTNGAPKSTSFVAPQRLAIDTLGQVWVSDYSAHRIRVLSIPTAACDDGQPCTKDACDAKGGCSFKQLSAGSSCSDGSACTTADVCNALGQCLGKAKVCSDGEPCTTDSCNAETGKCVFATTTAACDDGNQCTLNDNCTSGSCKPETKGNVKNVAGTGSAGFTDGNLTVARLYYPQGLDTAPDGRVFVADRYNHRIRVYETVKGNGLLSTFAGSGSASFLDGAANSARFYYPADVAWYAKGKVLYVADRNNHRVRKIQAGKVTTVAGNGSTGLIDGLGSSARFYYPEGIAVDLKGVVYVSDTYHHAIRRISANGTVTTLAGTNSAGYVNALGKSARFNYPRGLTVLDDGSLIVADTNNHRLRKVTQGGQVSLFAGNGSASYQNGAVTSARFNSPFDVSRGVGNELLVADRSNHRIRRVANGQVSLLAGSGSASFLDGASSTARFYYPSGVAMDVQGQVWIADYQNHRLRRIAAGTAQCDDRNTCTTDSCSPTKGCTFTSKGAQTACDDGSACTSNDACDADGFCSGKPKVCDDNQPCTLNICDAGTGACSFPATTSNCDDGDACTVGESCLSGSCEVPDSIYTWVGNGSAGYTNGKGTGGRVNYPRGLARAPDGSVYLADRNNHRIRKIAPDGTISLHAGSGSASFLDGAAASARFYYPSDVAVSLDGLTVYVADRYNHRIRKISGGSVSTLAGGSSGFANGQGSSARFTYPEGVAVDPVDGSVIVADSYNNRIRRVTASGLATTVAGSGSSSYKEGKGTTANFYRPHGVDVDAAGVIYVADSYNHRIRRIQPDGTTELLAGSSSGFADGSGVAGRMNYPSDVSVRADGKLLIADRANHRIRLLDPFTKQLTTLAGSSGGFQDGTIAVARFNSPYNALALPQGNDGSWPMLVSDFSNHRIRATTKTASVDCNDGNPCTIDSCDPKIGCTYVPVVGECKLGQLVFKKVGTSTWVVPKGVTEIAAVAVGGGGGGGGGTTGSLGGSGGAGGALVWGNKIVVTPGETLTIVVGAGGAAGYGSTTGKAGTETILRRGSQVLMLAKGGAGGKSNNGGTTPATSAGIGSYKYNQGGGNGGGAPNGSGCGGSGGGGAGGYSGAGGLGANPCTGPGKNGAGGGGGGGAGSNGRTAGGGGGVGLTGLGANGTGGIYEGGGGAGGSGGGNGATGTGNNGNGNGGTYGGGGGGAYDTSNAKGSPGAQGALRIIWGNGRSFPSNGKDV